ncbi:ATP-binding cassette sub-family C member 4 isoform X1 [Patella vulgata]|uniref:ATP-binding cassette sub-family C member 4 isoform X1 n=2 Tax=Patella vulgata TaxID=6465 RepID=UPI0024A87635|nr:ATP-binding cassette sub-family C member 4 isoform X1 [Patella vulgata]
MNNILNCGWTGRIFWKGYHHTLDEADVYDVLPQDSTVKLSNNLGREWEKELYRWKKGGSVSLMAALWRCYRPQILAFILLIMIEECLRVIQAVLMGYFINIFDVDSKSPDKLRFPDVYIFATFLCIVCLVNIFLDHNFFHHGYRMRVAATSLIYRKVMKLSSHILSPKIMEDIMNLVTREMDVFPMVVLPATYIIIAPVQLLVISYLLWDWLRLGPVCLAGLVVLLLLFPLQILMGKLSRILRQKTDTYTNHRLRKLQLMISGIHEIKMGCWEKFCEKIIMNARHEEQRHMKKLTRLLSFNSALTLTAGKLVMFVTFMLVLVTGRKVVAMQIFTAMSLFETLRISLSILLPSGILFFSDAMKTIHKIQEILILDERNSSSVRRVDYQDLQDNIAVKFTNYFASKEKGIDAAMVLSNIDLDIEKNNLYAVIGPAESGKSCLLMSITGELERQKGHLFHHGRLAYVPCQPWLFPGTIRENIIFGAEFGRYRYNQVLQACALLQLFDTLPQKDLTLIGERGVIIDNTMQAKITLARAVYQNCDIYLIDDILSGMDAMSAMLIYKRCICGILKSKTRILVTDNMHHARVADKLIVMSDGNVNYCGKFDDLEKWGMNINNFLSAGFYKNMDVSKLIDMSPPLLNESGSSSLATSVPSNQDTLKDSLNGSLEVLHHEVKDPSDAFFVGETEPSHHSTIPTGSIYKHYFMIGGGMCGVLLFIILSIFEQGSFILCEWWLAYWAEQYQDMNTTNLVNTTIFGPAILSLDARVYIYLGIVFVTVVIGFLQAGLFFYMVRRAAQVLHNMALILLMQAPISFFDINGIGAVLSRYLRDVCIVDALPALFLDCLQSFSVLFSTMLVVGVTNYWLFLLVVPLTVAFLIARHYYLHSTQDVERIELAAKGAVGSHVVSSMEGIQTLRSFGVEQRFLHNFDVNQDRSTAACYLHLAANRWFGMRVDLIGFLLIVGVVIGSILVVNYQGAPIHSSVIGLSLFYALNLLNVHQPAMKKSAAVHFKMSSVERLFQCYQITPELDLSETDIKPSLNWPQYGILTLEGVTLTQTSKGPNILKSVWCCIRAEEKIGLLFKSAAEQQAFINVLFRMIDYLGVVRIDGVDIQNIALPRLRDKIAIIPQNPTLFLGTIRQNLDPIARYTDAQVWRVLEEVNLSSFVESLPQRLYTDISSIVDLFTVGHRQLFRLCRAMLRQSKIVIYEEPSSSLDNRCNAIILSTLKTRFSRCTVIHMSHLPDTVVDYDRVMMVSDGRIQEVDSPHLLLQNKNSQFYKLTEELGLSQMDKLQQIARDKYENKPYRSPPINPDDFDDNIVPRLDIRSPNNINVIPSFHSSRLVGVLNHLPTNKFSTNRI